MSVSPALDMRSGGHPVDRRPPVGRLVALGAQHVVSMHTGCVSAHVTFGAAVGLVTRDTAQLISADLLISGKATVVQTLGVGPMLGVRLPVTCRGPFSALAPMILIAHQYEMPAVYMVDRFPCFGAHCAGKRDHPGSHDGIRAQSAPQFHQLRGGARAALADRSAAAGSAPATLTTTTAGDWHGPS